MQCPECNKDNALQLTDGVYRCQFCQSQFRLKEKTGYLDLSKHLKGFKSSLSAKEKALSLTKIAGAATANTALFGGSLIVNLAEQSLKHAGETLKSKSGELAHRASSPTTDADETRLCTACRGTGKISCPMQQIHYRDHCPPDCPSCHGSDKTLCQACYGAGVID